MIWGFLIVIKFLNFGTLKPGKCVEKTKKNKDKWLLKKILLW